jgi:regulator of ribonuclease activity B
MAQEKSGSAKQEVSRHNGSVQGAEMSQELQEWQEETAEIIAELLEDGSDPDVEYPIEHHFAALDFDCLEKLAVDLYKAGFEVEDAEEVELDDGAIVFCFDATKEGSLNVERITAEISTLLPLCKKYRVDYDGWGTYFAE